MARACESTVKAVPISVMSDRKPFHNNIKYFPVELDIEGLVIRS